MLQGYKQLGYAIVVAIVNACTTYWAQKVLVPMHRQHEMAYPRPSVVYIINTLL